MKSVTISSASDVVVMNAADSNREGVIAFGPGTQRHVHTLTGHESITPSVQSGGAIRTDSPENTSPVSGGNKKCSVSRKSERKVLHADVNGQNVNSRESLSSEGTSSGLSDRVINLSNSKETSLFTSDPVIITATEKNNSRSGMRSCSTVRPQNSNTGIWIENQLKKQPDKTGNIPVGVDIPAINLTAQEKNPVLKGSVDVGSVEKSPLTRTEIPEDLIARSRPECTGAQSSAPEFLPGSGARQKTVPAISRKKQRQSRKNAGNRAGSNVVKDTAITPPIHSDVIAFVQDETGKEKVATRQPIKKQLVQPASLSQQLLQAGRNELMAFNNKVKKLFERASSMQWTRVEEITGNLERVDPLFENLIREYETLADSYPASSIGKHKSGKTGNNSVDGVIFTYLHRSDVAANFCRIAREMIGSIGAFLISNRKCEKHHGSLLESMLKMICVWLRFAMECRINDWQAINDRGEGVFVVDTTDSGSSGNRIPLKSLMTEPRYNEDVINKVFYLALSWLVTNEIFYSKHAKDEHQSKSEYLTACPQLLMQLLKRYRKHRSFRNYIPCSETENLLDKHLDYANQLFFGVRVQDWDSVQMTLQQLVSLGRLEGALPIVKQTLGNPVQQGREFREAPEESEEQLEMENIAVIRKMILGRWRTKCEEKYLYALHEYLVMGIDAGHCGFNYFGREVIGSMAKQKRCSLNVESLRNLLLGFEYWTERMIHYELVTTPEHSIIPSYLSAKGRLAENIQQLDKIHQETQEFLVRCFQDEVVHRTAGSASRKERTKKIHRKVSVACPEEESLPDATSTTVPSVVVPTDSRTVDAVATVEVEPVEQEESFSDEENGWQQVKSGRRRIPAETAVKDLSEALYGSDEKGAIAVLKTTNLNDACQQLQDRPQRQETDVLMSLISGYLQVREMTSHVGSCMALTPEIQPFITSLEVRDQLVSSVQKAQFMDAVKRFSSADVLARQALKGICTHINTLLNLQEKAGASSESEIAIMTAINILAVPAQSLKEQLSNFREGIINVWRKRFDLLRNIGPSSLLLQASRRESSLMQVIMAHNRDFRRLGCELEERLNLCQQRQEAVSEARQPSSDSSGSPLQAQMTVPMDIASRLEVLNLSLEEVPSITVLGHRLDFIDHHTPDDASCMNMLARVASRLDIEISVYPFSSNTARKLARVRDKPQTAQRPPLNQLFAQSFVSDGSERIRSIRNHFHLSIPAILANLDSSGMLVALTGSAAFQYHVLSLWDSTQQDSPLAHLYGQVAQNLPQGITHGHMRASMTPRDTDLIVLNHSQFDDILQRLKSFLDQVCLAWRDLEDEFGEVIIANNMEITTSFGTVITSGRVVVLSNTGKDRRGEIYYVIDVAKGVYPDQPSSDSYTTRPLEDSHIYIRRIDDIILDEVNIINPTSTGVDGNRREKAITRLFMIAFLECQQPKLDSVSRMALLHALSSLPGEDPVITELTEQLRQRPFYIVCHEGRCQGARKTASEQP